MVRRKRTRGALRSITTIVIAAAFATAIGASTAYACRSEVAAEIEKRGIAAERITKIDFFRISSGGEGGQSVHSEAWVKIEGCTGSVVVNVDNRSCRVIDSYSRGSC